MSMTLVGLLLLLVSPAASAPVKTAIVVPGWPKLPFPFETGILTCLVPGHPCMMHVSGLPGIDFTLKPPGIVPGGIANETRQALTNIGTVAAAAGSSLDNFMECTVLLAKGAGESAFSEMNGAYKEFFGDVKPTRAAYFVDLVGGKALVEIKCSGWAPAPSGSDTGVAVAA